MAVADQEPNRTGCSGFWVLGSGFVFTFEVGVFEVPVEIAVQVQVNPEP
jgi:hypothetical protein